MKKPRPIKERGLLLPPSLPDASYPSMWPALTVLSFLNSAIVHRRDKLWGFHNRRAPMKTFDFEVKISSSELSSLVGAKAKDIDNWLQRGELILRFKSTRIGAKRSMSHDNVLELAFIAALARAGIKQATAVRTAAQLLRAFKKGELKQWMLFEGSDDPSSARQYDQFPSNDLIETSASTARPAVITIINIGETIRRVDGVFTTGLISRELKRSDSPPQDL